MQAAIDSSKRRFDVDIPREISRIKKDMDVKEYRYPSFWLAIKKDFNKENINPTLVCPMNYLYELKLSKFRSNTSTIPIEEFLINHKVKTNRTTCKRIEKLIQDYNLEMYKSTGEKKEYDDYLLLRSDFDLLINEIRKSAISKNYLDFMSWILRKTFSTKSNGKRKGSNVAKNKSLLLKILYTTSPKTLLKCFNSSEK